MAILNQEELWKAVTDLVGDRTDDDALNAMENIQETVNQLFTPPSEDWKKKFEENDKSWREKYKARFMDGSINQSPNDDSNGNLDTNPEEVTFSDLFIKEE
jgi:hypothetical protein